MYRLSVTRRALNWLKTETKGKTPFQDAGIHVKSVICDTQIQSIAPEGKTGSEPREMSGGAVTLLLHTDTHELSAGQAQTLASLVHGVLNSSHQHTQSQLRSLFIRTEGRRGQRQDVSRQLKFYKPVDVHTVIRDSSATIYHRIRLTRRRKGLDIEIRSWQPEWFDPTGLKKTGTNPDGMKSGFVRGLQQLEAGLKEFEVPVQWPKQRQEHGYQSVRPLR